VTVQNTVPDTTDPTVSLTAPSGGATVSGSSVSVSASASDNVGVSGVQFQVDGSDLGAEDTSSPFGTTWNSTAVSNGSHTLKAIARDAAGNTSSSSISVTVQNTVPDTTDPTVSLTAPSGGATVSGSSVSVSASASDDVGVSGVQFQVDGSDLGAEDTTSPYGTTWNSTSFADGTHTLEATARDAAGNTSSSSISVTTQNTVTPPPTTDTTLPTPDAMPIVNLTSPLSGQAFDKSLNLAATASDDVAVTKVEFWLDSKLLATDKSAPYSYSLRVRKPDRLSYGSHTATARAFDGAGNAASSAVTVTRTSSASVASLRAVIKALRGEGSSEAAGLQASTSRAGLEVRGPNVKAKITLTRCAGKTGKSSQRIPLTLTHGKAAGKLAGRPGRQCVLRIS
jgi:hypothetical protein